MATHTSNGTPLTLAVYVVGISGNCSKDYIGCGKSCLCRQFMYDEYAEELYSTLLQAEFDSCVIGRQHAIYWGQKEETYTANTGVEEWRMCNYTAKVNYEVFEHTLLYQDATGLPYTGKPYNQQIFTPLSKFLNKLSFKSRDLILSPEEYDIQTFSYIYKVPIAYLYVVDVSQSCPVFMKQLELMNGLIKAIKKKKSHCVIVANQYDTHSKKNMENLELWASALNVDVIQCSAKYNINIDSAFKYLAMKVFSRQLGRKFTFNLQTYAEVAVEKRRAISTESSNHSVYINTIPHILENEVTDSSLASQTVQSDLTSSAVAREIKNSITDNISLESPSEACATFCSTDDDYDDDKYEFPPDVVDDKPKCCSDKKDRRYDNSLHSATGDEHTGPEVEFPFRAKRSASFRKAAFNSFKHNFITKSRSTAAKCSNSSQEFLVIANDHVDSLNSFDSSSVDNLNIQHSQLSNGISKKRMCSNPK